MSAMARSSTVHTSTWALTPSRTLWGAGVRDLYLSPCLAAQAMAAAQPNPTLQIRALPPPPQTVGQIAAQVRMESMTEPLTRLIQQVLPRLVYS